MKIIQYCQHVLGIGHFFRSMEIARALHRHELLFVEGGEPLAGYAAPGHVRRAFLPPLRMDADFKQVEAAAGDVDAIKGERQRLLWNLFREFQPDAFIIELFPFGRKNFRGELLPILDHIRANRLDTRVICSLRDILVEKSDQEAYEKRVVKTLNEYFDLLLVHADPRIIALEETFSATAQIDIPIEYTGFVAKAAVRRPFTHEGNVIVASSGGGKVGVDLLAAVIKAVGSLRDADLRLRIFVGPFMEPGDQALLADLAGSDGRVGLEPFSFDFARELGSADLSISMAGYNTCMDILSTGVKALVYPFQQNREQAMRARRLESFGLLQVIERLDEANLAAHIRRALRQRPATPRLIPDFQGAANTALLVESLTRSH
jgi:predicted glycosyltransferase